MFSSREIEMHFVGVVSLAIYYLGSICSIHIIYIYIGKYIDKPALSYSINLYQLLRNYIILKQLSRDDVLYFVFIILL